MIERVAPSWTLLDVRLPFVKRESLKETSKFFELSGTLDLYVRDGVKHWEMSEVSHSLSLTASGVSRGSTSRGMVLELTTILIFIDGRMMG